MQKLYALINPVTNKLVQFSEFRNDDFKVANIEFVNGERILTEHIAICVLVDYSPDLKNKTYDPITGTFLD